MPKLITTQTRIEYLGNPRVAIFDGGTGKILQRLLYQTSLPPRKTASVASLFRNRVSIVNDFFPAPEGTVTNMATRTSLGEYINASTRTDQPSHKPPLTRFGYKCAMTTTDRNKTVLKVIPSCFRRCFASVAKPFQLLHVPIRYRNKISSLSIGSTITFCANKGNLLMTPVHKMTCTNNG